MIINSSLQLGSHTPVSYLDFASSHHSVLNTFLFLLPEHSARLVLSLAKYPTCDIKCTCNIYPVSTPCVYSETEPLRNFDNRKLTRTVEINYKSIMTMDINFKILSEKLII